MPLDVNKLEPLKGKFTSNLWENSYIDLPLTLFYSIEIPLKPFDSGHSYVDQPISTSIVIEWIKFFDSETRQNVGNWKSFVGNEYLISYDDDTGEGSIYLGTEHCQFDSKIHFLSLAETTFDIELTLNANFNTETTNLDRKSEFKIRAQIDYLGLLLYENASLPTFSNVAEPMSIISHFVDETFYDSELDNYQLSNLECKILRPIP